MKRSLLTIIIFFSIISLGISEEEARTTTNKDISERVDLIGLIKSAYQENPRLKSARLKWGASIERAPQAASLDDPKITSSFLIADDEKKLRILLSQEFPFFGKLGAMKDISLADAKIAKLEFEKTTRDTISELKEAFYELAYIDKAVDITSKNKEIVEQLSKISRKDYSPADDGTTLNDILRGESQLAQVSYDLTFLSELREVETAKINAILGRPINTAIAKTKDPEYIPFEHKADDLYKMAEGNREELKIIEAEIERLNKEKKLASLAYYPNFMAGVGVELGLGEMDKNGFMADIGLSIPLWRGKYRAREREAALDIEAAAAMKKDELNMTLSNIRELYFKIKNSERLIRLYKDSLIPQADQAMETAEAWYNDKKGSFTGMIETEIVWLNFNLALHRAVSDYYQYITRLETVIGKDLGGAR